MKQMKAQLIDTPKLLKKEKYKARIKAKVKLRLQKELSKIENNFILTLNKLKEISLDIDQFNPRLTQLQVHTKAKWSVELNQTVIMFEDILNKISSSKGPKER